MQKLEVPSVIVSAILSFFHHLCKVLHELSCIYSLLFSTRQDVLQSASVVTPYEIYVAYILTMECALDVSSFFLHKFVNSLLPLYPFEFFPQKLRDVFRLFIAVFLLLCLIVTSVIIVVLRKCRWNIYTPVCFGREIYTFFFRPAK